MATINYLTTIEFDFGAVAKLADSVRALGIRKPMLVTDAGLADGDCDGARARGDRPIASR